MHNLELPAPLLPSFSSYLIKNYGTDLSNKIIILPSMHALISFQQSFKLYSETIIMPQIWLADQIKQIEQFQQINPPIILSKNVSILSFALYLNQKIPHNNFVQLISNIRQLFSWLEQMIKHNYSIFDLNEIVKNSPYYVHLYQSYPLDILSEWESNLDAIYFQTDCSVYPYYYIHKLAVQQIFELLEKKNEDNLNNPNSIRYNIKHILESNNYGDLKNKGNDLVYWVDPDPVLCKKIINKYQDIQFVNESSDNIDSLQEKVILNTESYLFLDNHTQLEFAAKFISNVINDQKDSTQLNYILNQKIGLIGLDSNCQQILTYQLEKYGIYLSQSIAWNQLNTAVPEHVIEIPISFLRHHSNFVKFESEIIQYLLKNSYVNISGCSERIIVYNNIDNLIWHDCEVLICLTQNPVIFPVLDRLNLLDKELLHVQAEQKLWKALAKAKRVLLLHDERKIYQVFWNKLQCKIKANKIQQLTHKTQYVKVQDCVTIPSLPSSFTLTELDHLLNQPYVFFVNDILKLRPPKLMELSPINLGIILHEILSQMCQTYCYEPKYFCQLFLKAIENFKDLRKYQLIYQPFVNIVATQMCKICQHYFSIPENVSFEKEFSVDNISFRCDALINFNLKNLRVIEYKLSNQPLNKFYFQIVMQMFLLGKQVEYSQKKISGTIMTIAPNQSFNTKSLVLSDYMNIINKYKDFNFCQSNYQIYYQGELAYKHFARDLD